MNCIRNMVWMMKIDSCVQMQHETPPVVHNHFMSIKSSYASWIQRKEEKNRQKYIIFFSILFLFFNEWDILSKPKQNTRKLAS